MKGILDMARSQNRQLSPCTNKGRLPSRYLARFGNEAHTAPAYEHNAEFSRVLEDRMAFYSTDQRVDTINRVRGEISEVKTVMVENIDKVRWLIARPALLSCLPLRCCSTCGN